jgi:hypothetical protein
VPIIPALRRLSKENREANLGYIARLYLKKKNYSFSDFEMYSTPLFITIIIGYNILITEAYSHNRNFIFFD